MGGGIGREAVLGGAVLRGTTVQTISDYQRGLRIREDNRRRDFWVKSRGTYRIFPIIGRPIIGDADYRRRSSDP